MLSLFLDFVFGEIQDRAEISELAVYGKAGNCRPFGIQALAGFASGAALGILSVSAFWLSQVLGLVTRLRTACATACDQRPDPRADSDQRSAVLLESLGRGDGPAANQHMWRGRAEGTGRGRGDKGA